MFTSSVVDRSQAPVRSSWHVHLECGRCRVKPLSGQAGMFTSSVVDRRVKPLSGQAGMFTSSVVDRSQAPVRSSWHVHLECGRCRVKPLSGQAGMFTSSVVDVESSPCQVKLACSPQVW